MDQNLKFIITGDASGLNKATNSTTKSLNQLSAKIKQLQNDIASNVKISLGYEDAIKKLQAQFRNGSITQDQYNASVKRLRVSEKETGIETQNLRRQLNLLQRDQKSLSLASSGLINSNNRLQKSMQGVRNNSGSANTAVVAFTGIIQDANYGIRGVANNIQFFTQSMTYLAASTGGAAQGLRAFWSALAGPAGILLAVSLVTVALERMSFSTSKEEKEADKLNKTLERLSSTSRGLTKSNLEGEKAALDESFALEQLRKQAEDTSISMNKRLDAVNELQDKYPNYLGNISQEDILAGNLAGTYETLAKNILEASKARAASDLVTENAKELLTLQSGVNRINEEITKEKEKQAKLEREAIDLISTNQRGSETVRQQSIKQGEIVNKLEEERNNLIRRQGELAFDNLKLGEEFEKILKESGLSFTDLFNFGGDAGKEIEQRLKNLTPLPSIPINLDLNDASIDNLAKAIDQKALSITDAFKLIENGTVQMGNVVKPEIEDINNALLNLQVPKVDYSDVINGVKEIRRNLDPMIFDEFRDKLYSLNDVQLNGLRSELTATNIFADALGSGLGAFASELSSMIETESKIVNAFMSSIIQSGANLLTQLIAQWLQQKIIKKTFSTGEVIANQATANAGAISAAAQTAATFGPAAAFALPGLIALTTGAVNTAFAPVYAGLAFAQGGIVPGGSFTGDKVPAMVNSGEMILTNRQQSNLFGMLNSFNPVRIKSTENNIVATTTVRGSDLLLILERAQRKNRRYGSGINN